MAWRERMGPASFRGVQFYVDAAELRSGRKAVIHEYPLRDEPFVEDLGRRVRSLPVEGYILGADYMERRDTLIAALEERGPGELVHPYYGTRRVICTSFTVRESREDGGIARFTIQFEETPAAPKYPTAQADTKAVIRSRAQAAASAIGREFTSRYDPSRRSSVSLERIASIVTAAARKMDAVFRPVVSGTQQLASIKRQIDHIILDVDQLIRAPFDVVSQFTSVVSSFGSAASTPRLGIDALLQAYGFTPSESRPEATTEGGRRDAQNYDAMEQMIRRLAVIEAAQLAPTGTYDSYDDAVKTRDAIAGLLDEQAEVAETDTFSALVQLRAELVRGVPGDNHGLARLIHYKPPTTTPSLVLAYRLYGSVSEEADILARNRIRHPGFVVGGRELEILSRG